MYEIFLSKEARRVYERTSPDLVRRFNRCFQHLAQNPYEHPNIKRLKGPLSGYFRYRVGDWRIIYQVNEQERKVVVLLIVHRSQAYR